MPLDRQLITSRQNPTVQKLVSLLDKKERRKSGLFRIDGFKLLAEAVACSLDIERVFIRGSNSEELTERVESLCPSLSIVYLSDEVFAKITDERAPEGVVATVHEIASRHRTVCASDGARIAELPGRVMAFEAIRDPGNLGAVIRSASAFGVDTLILSSDCADIYNPKTLRGAMGAVFSRNILICSELPKLLSEISKCGRRTLAATLSDDAVSVEDVGLSPFDIVVIGNEGHGLSVATCEACDACVILPIESGPGVESLNASVAASVFMWEQRRLSAK